MKEERGSQTRMGHPCLQVGSFVLGGKPCSFLREQEARLGKQRDGWVLVVPFPACSWMSLCRPGPYHQSCCCRQQQLCPLSVFGLCVYPGCSGCLGVQDAGRENRAQLVWAGEQTLGS